ncbi:hypothetical protein [Lentimicrobium sp. S6]|uniref:hypothetical protein n=1 Tax=Lentimicrobium sp. S6 TaxID=2735872 RepID=UPI00155307C4|nr:hypothetical protein [Lentimicrobium sp. S6]NPD46369.1 hypothetical protein [Lentimicrobium sp. S6]
MTQNIDAYYPVRAGNNFLVYTQMNDKEQFWMVSLTSGKLLWKQDLDLDHDKEIAGGFISIEEDEEAKGLMCNPVGDSKGGVFTAVHDRLIYFNKSGEIVWNIQYPSMFGDQEGFFKAASVLYSNIFPDIKGENLYVFSGGYMSSFKVSTGELSWDKPVKVTGPVKNLIFEKEGMILIPASDNNAMKKHKLQFVDYNTGATKWGEKGIEFKGGYIQSRFCKNGIAFITKSYMAETFFLNIINQEEGSLELKKSIKIFPGPYEFEEVKGGLLISSPHGANIYNYETKELVINKELKTGGDDFLLKTKHKDQVYFYSSAKRYIIQFNTNTLEAKQFNIDKIKFDGGDEAKGLDSFEDGLALYSDQNLLKLDWDGKTIYKKYYPAPGAGFLNVAGNVLGATLKVMGGLAQVAASQAIVASVESYDQNMREGMDALDKAYVETKGYDADLAEYRKDVTEYKEGMDEAKQELNSDMQEMAAMGVLNAVDLGDNIKAISERFKNSKATKKYVLLMTKDKERGGIGLAIVSKLDGDIKGFIPMKFSKENPSYTVDPFSNILFWMPNLDNGTNTFGKYNDIKKMEKSGTILSFDLNTL